MEVKGKLNSIAKKYKAPTMIIALEVEGMTDAMIEELQGKPLRVRMTQYREKRSLDSNAYMWTLTSKIADKLNSTMEAEHKRQMLEYGKADLIDGEPVVITVLSKVDMDRIEGYWKYYDESDDGKWKSYYQLRPTHIMDTKEMSNFLEHIIEEAKELGIETATPDELKRMEALYEKQHHHR